MPVTVSASAAEEEHSFGGDLHSRGVNAEAERPGQVVVGRMFWAWLSSGFRRWRTTLFACVRGARSMCPRSSKRSAIRSLSASRIGRRAPRQKRAPISPSTSRRGEPLNRSSSRWSSRTTRTSCLAAPHSTTSSLELGRAAIGYWLAPHARGRGVATRAVRLIFPLGIRGSASSRLELTCGPDNGASQRVAERCGFTREGVLRSHIPFKGARRDTVVFSLLPGELS